MSSPYSRGYARISDKPNPQQIFEDVPSRMQKIRERKAEEKRRKEAAEQQQINCKAYGIIHQLSDYIAESRIDHPGQKWRKISPVQMIDCNKEKAKKVVEVLKDQGLKVRLGKGNSRAQLPLTGYHLKVLDEEVAGTHCVIL